MPANANPKTQTAITCRNSSSYFSPVRAACRVPVASTKLTRPGSGTIPRLSAQTPAFLIVELDLSTPFDFLVASAAGDCNHAFRNVVN
jgi:hypothetical protein